MRVIYTSKGMSKKFGVRAIYRKIRYCVIFMVHNVIYKCVRGRLTLTGGPRFGYPLVDRFCFRSFIVVKRCVGRGFLELFHCALDSE